MWAWWSSLDPGATVFLTMCAFAAAVVLGIFVVSGIIGIVDRVCDPLSQRQRARIAEANARTAEANARRAELAALLAPPAAERLPTAAEVRGDSAPDVETSRVDLAKG